jgi:preprotein translocase subunit SecB
MTDVSPADASGTPAQPPIAGFRILAQYVRDLSFENPRAPDSQRLEGKHQIDMGVELKAAGRPDGLFEVDLKLSIKASTETTPVFHVELLYGGLFQLQGVSEQDIEPMLLIECPRYLFPYAREIVARATSDGGFYPPFMLDPIDFAGIYAARMAQAAQQPGAA